MDNSSGREETSGKIPVKYKQHWHIVFTHFPISFFIVSFGFMLLHFFTAHNCYSLAAYVTLIAGAVAMIPTTLTGWFTWKDRYKGNKGKLFLIKIRFSFGMIAVSTFLVIYRTVFTFQYVDILHNIWHTIYFTGILFLLIGALAEGHFGGRLNHH